MIYDTQTSIWYNWNFRSNGVNGLDLTFYHPVRWFSQTDEFFLTFEARSFSQLKSWSIVQIKWEMIRVGVMLYCRKPSRIVAKLSCCIEIVQVCCHNQGFILSMSHCLGKWQNSGDFFASFFHRAFPGGRHSVK